METPTKAHEIRVTVRKDAAANKWRIRVSGLTSGVKIHVADELAAEFSLDAARFHPVIKNH